MVTGDKGGILLTTGDLARRPEFHEYTVRQIDYAIQTARIDPVQRCGITRLFREAQIPWILSSLRRTARERL